MHARIAALIVLMAACAAPRQLVRPGPPSVGAGSGAEEPPTFRLPTTIAPTRAMLELTLDPDATTTTGTVHFDATVTASTAVVWLNAVDLQIAHAELAGEPARVITTTTGFLGLALAHPIPPGPLAIDLAFTAPIDHGKARGIYAEREGDATQGANYLYTFFEPVDARRAFPCFDEPSFKIPWHLVLHTKQGQLARANAPLHGEPTVEPGGMLRFDFEPSRPMPSYLVAFVAGPFLDIDGGVAGQQGIPIHFLVPRGREGELAYAKAVTPKVVTALEAYFGMPYPFFKLDVAVVPRYWGTMEHPGIVAMGQPLTLIRPEQATRDRREAYANILAHELSHYWFGDYVTMAWWDDTWLNEAMGEWSDMNITDAAEPTWHVRDSRVAYATQAMRTDEKLATHPMRIPITNTSDIEGSFDNDITYFKGASVMRMFEAYVGVTRWQAFIRDYLTAHAWGNASGDDFFAAVKQTLGAQTEAELRSFVEQPGVPLVEAKADCQAKAITITQTRSLPAGVVDPTPRSWRIPMCLTYGTGKTGLRACFELHEASATLPIATCPTWIEPNADATGYYRSRRDDASLAHTLAAGTPDEKLMAIADLGAAVDRGELQIDRKLALAPTLATDQVDRVAIAAFDAAHARFDAYDDALYLAARTYSLATFTPLATRLGWQRGAKDSDDRERLRAMALAEVAAFDPKLGDQGARLADAWIATHQGLPDDLVDGALATAVYRGDAIRFDRYVAAAKAARDHAEQKRILAALGNAVAPALAQRALALVLAPDFDVRDTRIILASQFAMRETRPAAIQWFAAHVGELIGKLRGDEMTGTLELVAGSPCDAAQRDELARVINPIVAQVDGAATSVPRAFEADDQCIATMARQRPAIEAFFASRSASRPGHLRPAR